MRQRLLVKRGRWVFDVEAKAIADILERHGSALRNSKVLDVGSSTGKYREQKPHLAHLHEVIVAGGGAYIGLDMKDALGVDLVGDITAPATLAAIKEIAPKVILLNNILEHLEDPWAVLRSVWGAVPKNGMLVVSVPLSFPYHPDPIDTMFRPRPAEIIKALGARTVIVDTVLEDHSLWSKWNRQGLGYLAYRLARSLAKLVLKSPLDYRYLFYSDFRWLFKRLSVSLVAVEKS